MKKFKDRKRATVIQYVLDGHTLSDAARKFEVSPQRISEMVETFARKHIKDDRIEYLAAKRIVSEYKDQLSRLIRAAL